MTGFTSPQYTQTPNDLFDLVMRDMEKSELKVVLAVIRKTLGFHTKVARMSMREIQDMTGLSSGAVYAGVEAAAARGLLVRTNRPGVTEWRINWNDKPLDKIEQGILETPEIPPIGTEVFRPAEQDVPIIGTPSIKETLKDTERNKHAAAPGAAAASQQDRVQAILEKQGHHPELGYIGGYGGSRLSQGQVDLSHFPEPYQIVLERFCRLWRVEPPIKVGGKKSGAFGDWIVSARELMTAYGEYGPELLDVVYWSGDWLKPDGNPMSIGRPGSIHKWVSGWCGSLRQRGIKPEQLSDQVERLRPQFVKKASAEVLGVSNENYAERLAKRKQIELDARAKAK